MKLISVPKSAAVCEILQVCRKAMPFFHNIPLGLKVPSTKKTTIVIRKTK